jgi:hypothetical protein
MSTLTLERVPEPAVVTDERPAAENGRRSCRVGLFAAAVAVAAAAAITGAAVSADDSSTDTPATEAGIDMFAQDPQVVAWPSSGETLNEVDLFAQDPRVVTWPSSADAWVEVDMFAQPPAPAPWPSGNLILGA